MSEQENQMSEQEEFRLWMRKIKGFDASWLGFWVVVVTLLASAAGGWYGIALFTNGTYLNSSLLHLGW